MNRKLLHAPDALKGRHELNLGLNQILLEGPQEGKNKVLTLSNILTIAGLSDTPLEEIPIEQMVNLYLYSIELLKDVPIDQGSITINLTPKEVMHINEGLKEKYPSLRVLEMSLRDFENRVGLQDREVPSPPALYLSMMEWVRMEALTDRIVLLVGEDL